MDSGEEVAAPIGLVQKNDAVRRTDSGAPDGGESAG